MKLESFLKQHPSLHYAEDIKNICAPLSELGIVYFSHVIIDEQFKMSCLGIRPEFFKLYFEKGYYHFDLHMAKISNHEQYILWDTVERKKQTKNLHEDFMSFDQGHTFSIALNNKNCREYFHFGAKLGNSSINEKYLQWLSELKLFTLYFKDKIAGHKELSAAYDLKLKLIQNAGGYLTKKDTNNVIHEKFYNAMVFDRIYFNNDTYITKREFECMHWTSIGKTAEDIAEILNISIRTVKAHIINIKNKLGCRNQFQLGMMYEKLKRAKL